jgi:type I restriction enzyme M protein
MANEQIERDVETLIDIQLKQLGWVDDPKSNKRNVWKQQPKNKEDSFFNEIIALKYIDEDSINTISKKVVESRSELINIFKEANKILRTEGLQAGHQRFSVFSNILFLKLMSEMQELNESNGEKVTIPHEFRWNFFKKKNGEELLSYINKIVLKKFDECYMDNEESIFGKIEICNPTTLKSIINKLDELQLTDIDSDIKGDAFEFFIKNYNAGDKDLGEYFTPRHIVKFLIKLINPKFGETIYDPFCGTGGMLIEAFKFIYKTSPKNDQTIKFLKEYSIFGREISTTSKIAKMNMILLGDGHSNIEKVDTLENPVENKYDIVVTNMPFSQNTEHGNLYKLPSRDANSICIQHCIKSINSASENGRIGIIVPEKVLFDKSYKELRQYIYETCYIENIISLTSGTFEPYTNVQTSILYLTKIKKSIKNKDINFYFVKNDGFSLDKSKKKILGENDLDNYFEKQNRNNEIKVDIKKIIENDYILQGKKYIPPSELAGIIFNTDKLMPLSKIIRKIKSTKIKIDDALDYKELGIKSYGAGFIHKQIRKGYELTKSMGYFKVKENCLIWCKVDTKNGAFAVSSKYEEDYIITSNFTMHEINTDLIEPYFLQILFKNKSIQEYFDNYISGSTNRKYVKIDELMNFFIPNIPIKKQKEIVKNVIESENIIRQKEKIISCNVENSLLI